MKLMLAKVLMWLLWKHIPPSDIAFIIALFFSDRKNYLKTRDKIFQGETVKSIADNIKVFQDQGRDN